MPENSGYWKTRDKIPEYYQGYPIVKDDPTANGIKVTWVFRKMGTVETILFSTKEVLASFDSTTHFEAIASLF
jgi:hypothetical protein